MRHVSLILFSFFIVTLTCCNDSSPIVDTKTNSLTDIISQEQFDQEVKAGVSLVFYHASWCTRCAAQRPAV
jgi:hypothetical protein